MYFKTREDYNKMMQLPFEDKIQASMCRIREWYELWNGQVYVSFGGGKDSTVLLDIARKCFADIEGVFLNTGLEYPEIVQFVKQQENITTIKPKYTFYEVIQKYGYPVVSKEQSQYISEVRNTKSEALRQKRLNGINGTNTGKISEKWKFLIDAPFKISDRCCCVLKKNPAKKFEKQSGKKPIIGNLAAESWLRESHYMQYGCNAYNLTRPVSNPLSFWNEQDILRYIVQSDLQIAGVYGSIQENNGNLSVSGVQRTGCMFCMFGTHKEECPNKFQRMKISHPQLYRYCIEKLEIGKVLDYINVPY